MKRLCLLCVLALTAACTETPTAAAPAASSGPRHDTVCDNNGGMTMGGGQVAPCP